MCCCVSDYVDGCCDRKSYLVMYIAESLGWVFPGGLRLASTSETGDVAIFRVNEPDAPGSMPTYTPELALKGAHSDVSPFC